MATYTIEWDVKPKEIDSSSNEENLDEYTITNTYTGQVDQRAVIATGDRISAKYIDTCDAFEIISDYAVTLVINSSITLTGVLNAIVNLSTALAVTSVTITNSSGSTANVMWRMWGTVTTTSA